MLDMKLTAEILDTQLNVEDAKHPSLDIELVEIKPSPPIDDIITNLIKSKKYDLALAEIDKCLIINPNDAKSLAHQGKCLAWLNRYAEGLIACDKALAITSSDYDIYKAIALESKGVCLYGLRRNDEALISFNNCMRIDPSSLIAVAGIAACLGNSLRFGEALEICDRALVMAPKNPAIYLLQGHTLSRFKLRSQAAQALLTALTMDKDLQVAQDYFKTITGTTFEKFNNKREHLTTALITHSFFNKPRKDHQEIVKLCVAYCLDPLEKETSTFSKMVSWVKNYF